MAHTTPAPVTYSGRRDKGSGVPYVYRGDRALSPAESQRVRNHSPDGFNWGYSGSGPAQLALALLLDAVGDAELAARHYQDFKSAVVAGWGERWDITPAEIWNWLGYDGTNAAALRG